MWQNKKKKTTSNTASTVKSRKAATKNESDHHKYQSLDKNYRDNINDDEDDEQLEDENERPTSMKNQRPEKPYKREYILRSNVSRPAPFSRQSPQRMYVLLSKDEFRLAGAFTEDTMFF
jgi:hypothetical protein